MKGAVGDAVHVDDVFARAHAELVQVEVRVSADERIERPIDDVTAELANELSLLLFEAASDADVPSLGAHGEHVGPVDDASSLDAGESEDESDEVPVWPESAEDHAAHALSDFQDARGNDVAETLAPGLALEVDARLKLIKPVERANLDRLWIHASAGGWGATVKRRARESSSQAE